MKKLFNSLLLFLMQRKQVTGKDLSPCKEKNLKFYSCKKFSIACVGLCVLVHTHTNPFYDIITK